MEKAVKHIVITGPESSGKTTLTKAIAKALNTDYTEEYAREYLNSNTSYKQEDLLLIAQGQLQKEKANANPIAIHDTDLITIKIWSEYKYNQCDPWILEQIEQQKSKNRIYLLCKPDIPWEADPLRENPSNRAELFKIYKKELEYLGHDYFVVDERVRLQLKILFS
ncbi:MAG: ATPase [Flavobacteriales bacterium]|nr:ATPase [Flavobacteriales bacterium]MBJ11063.1 ATPase [Flavobacteriales bacterium]|tara:strand:+ start:630 stop:1127 length:498 start_codon:yes stop_codon:yes gene_type:complete